ncbi:MAG: FAD-dependent oxidoreductase [Deltaproteobacteria bacterium]|nr:FAD-dependent oxidoreductase [Deltaproteobacteria bacterium]
MSDTEKRSSEYDVLILGAGAAGLTAAIYLARARRRVLVVDTGTAGGQMVLSYKVANYPGVEEASGQEIGLTMLRQARSFGAEVITQAEVVSLELEGEVKRIVVEDEGTFTAPAVILAVGGLPRRLGLPGEADFEGRGISYCATCDGDFFTGKEIAVIGGGNSALEEAVALTRYASKVTVLHEFPHFQAQSWIVDEARANPKIEFLLDQRVEAFEGEGSLQAVTSVDKATGQRHRVPVEGCFVFVGYVPNTGAFAGQLSLSERGEVVTDETLQTSLPGVFAAGDARQKRYRQITTAVADGTVAALSAVDFLESRAKVSHDQAA